MRAAMPFLAVLVAIPLAAGTSPALAAECSRTSVALTALPDLATGTYRGTTGGLYPGGVNEPPAAYAEAGRSAAAGIVPMDAAGKPSPAGEIVLLSIGMSNTTQEFSAFVPLAGADPHRAPAVIAVDGAQGGQDARVWAKADAQTWTVVEDRLRNAGVTSKQVQAIWLKQAVAGPRGDFASTSGELANLLAAIVENAAERYPNLQQVFVSPRTYAGYATTQLNPEPYAYESGFAVRDVVARSIDSPTARPWIGWGPYLWTDGTKGRSDGFTWACEDAAADGTHPSMSGRRKVADLLVAFFGSSPFTSWYREGATTPMASPLPSAANAPQGPPFVERPDEEEGDRGPLIVGGIAALVFAGTVFLLARRRA